MVDLLLGAHRRQASRQQPPLTCSSSWHDFAGPPPLRVRLAQLLLRIRLRLALSLFRPEVLVLVLDRLKDLDDVDRMPIHRRRPPRAHLHSAALDPQMMGTNPDGLGAEGHPTSLAPDQVGGVVVGLEALDKVHLGEQTFSVGDSGFAWRRLAGRGHRCRCPWRQGECCIMGSWLDLGTDGHNMNMER